MTDRPTAISRAIARSRGRAIDRDRSIDRRFTRARERHTLRSSRSRVRASALERRRVNRLEFDVNGRPIERDWIGVEIKGIESTANRDEIGFR